ncbi:hypothetical protein [uncultured Rhodoferax sp.]|uniref:hypothetical protein n=1 Tax=uncultured Rhodoferax sp. TaxID=223188 RepID=UPI0025D9F19B|nr:hypothetical protein [uncultured Rhodoferax sp.]
MRTIGTFNCGRWGKVSASRGTYDGANGPLAIVLTLANGEPLTTLSVNMYRPECSHDSKDLPADCFYVKTWGGNEAIAEDALKSGLFIERPDLPVAESGYVEASAWQLVGVAA